MSQAVLLDNFVQATARIEERDRVEARRRRRMERRLENPLDPLLERLARDHVDDGDLSGRIREVFMVGDMDQAVSGIDPWLVLCWMHTATYCMVVRCVRQSAVDGVLSGSIWKDFMVRGPWSPQVDETLSGLPGQGL